MGEVQYKNFTCNYYLSEVLLMQLLICNVVLIGFLFLTPIIGLLILLHFLLEVGNDKSLVNLTSDSISGSFQ